MGNVESAAESVLCCGGLNCAHRETSRQQSSAWRCGIVQSQAIAKAEVDSITERQWDIDQNKKAEMEYEKDISRGEDQSLQPEMANKAEAKGALSTVEEKGRAENGATSPTLDGVLEGRERNSFDAEDLVGAIDDGTMEEIFSELCSEMFGGHLDRDSAGSGNSMGTMGMCLTPLDDNSGSSMTSGLPLPSEDLEEPLLENAVGPPPQDALKNTENEVKEQKSTIVFPPNCDKQTKKRLLNREAVRRCRKRKKDLIEDLRRRVADLERENTHLREQVKDTEKRPTGRRDSEGGEECPH